MKRTSKFTEKKAQSRSKRTRALGGGNHPVGRFKSRAQIRRLARDLVQVTQDSAPPQLRHGDCEEMLSWYVADEQTGSNVQFLYPAVWNHLQACPRCTESYELLKAAWETGLSESSPVLRLPALPFLSDQPFEAWRLEKSSTLLTQNPRVGFQLNPIYLQKLLLRAQTGAASQYIFQRSGTNSLSESLLLSDAFPLGNQLIMVRAWLVWSSQSTDRADIQFQVASPDPLPERLVAHLHWGELEYETPVKGEMGRFTQLALPDLSRQGLSGRAGEFRLSFESREDEPE